MSGINTIIFYAKQLFLEIEHGNESEANFMSFELGILQVVMTIVSGVLLDNFGRRCLMLFGHTIIVGSLLMGYWFAEQKDISPSLIVLIVFSHIIGFSLSMGPIALLYIAEILENISPMVMLLWFETILVAMFSDYMITLMGLSHTFLLYAIISACCLLYLCVNMKETKGMNKR